MYHRTLSASFIVSREKRHEVSIIAEFSESGAFKYGNQTCVCIRRSDYFDVIDLTDYFDVIDLRYDRTFHRGDEESWLKSFIEDTWHNIDDFGNRIDGTAVSELVIREA